MTWCSVARALFALTRPGGGDLFDGGGSSDFGGGSGDGGDVDIGLIIDLVVLCIRYPALGGVVVTGAIVYFAAVRFKTGRNLPDWSSRVPSATVPVARAATVARGALARLRDWDPDFSVVLFEDFLYTLYAELHYARARGALPRLAPFLSPELLQRLAQSPPEQISWVIVGTLRLVELRTGDERVELSALFEANLTETRDQRAQRHYVVERLHVVRALRARSRPPLRARTLDCANCGAPLEGMRGTTCGYCGAEVGGGRLDWMIVDYQRVRSEARPALFSAQPEERGNTLPTVVGPELAPNLNALRERDPSFDLQALFARIRLIFEEVSAGWSARDLARIRPFVSDNLFSYFGYFVDLQLQEKLRNVHERARIQHLELANLLSDTSFDALTVRVFATALDYYVHDDGRLLAGSRERERSYTEYWTLIRGRLAKGRARTERNCPNCGAPLCIGMAGNCEYCHARVVTGQFDWVLSRIDQDDAYTG